MNMETTPVRSQPSRSLAATLASAFLTLSLAVLLISGGIQLFFNIQSQQQAITNQQQIIAENAAKSVSGFIDANFSALTTAVGITHPNTIPPEAQVQLLRSLLVNKPAFRQFALLDAHDKVTAEVTRTQVTSIKKITSYVTNEILLQSRKSNQYIGQVYFDPVNSEPVVLMAISIKSVLGEFQGTLIGELNLISMWNLVNQVKVGETGYAYVVDNKGKLIAYVDSTRALQGEDVSNIRPVKEFLKNPSTLLSQTANLYTGINNKLVVGSYVSLGSPIWVVVTELPWQEAFRQSFLLGAALLGVTILLAGLAVIAGVLISRRLSLPLINLTGIATSVSSGDWNQRAIVRGGREIEAMATAFNNMTDQLQELIGTLEERVAERTRVLERRSNELQNAAQIVREVSSIQDTDILLDRITRLVKERFGYYHIGIFLIDDNEEYAVLKSAGGEAGQLMLASKYRLRVGDETGIVGFVAHTGESRINVDIEKGSSNFQEPLLPYTRSEMALPLRLSNRIIGVLDIHSDKNNAFDQSSISVMRIVADQISVGIERTRLLEGLRQNASEFERMLQRNTARTWRNFLEPQKGSVGYYFDGVTIETQSHLPKKNLNENKKGATPVASTVEAYGTGNNLQVPIKLRGQTLGYLNFEFMTSEIPQDTIRFIEDAANRLALALENARLVQDAQRLAMRERQINIISAQTQQSTTLETLLQNTVRELGNALGMPKTFIQIGLLDVDPKSNDREGN
jgi:GAF domain-containing protein/HAMP domain-containing protein